MFDLEEMLKEITESEEYNKYKEIGSILESDPFIMNLMEEIRPEHIYEAISYRHG